ncbi:hypothetical protein EJ06DRAFT_533627 [Trichodelitschia bisporula]|uniref:Uncharacterized protein n=1 Tax=Trichodelitschia bisporula TaxID=703511 RepID=A0A6G1HM36_9PEZI|nr:hypothetical protein EJ06DRAFT_533627 [Trichodelitschia bisporula]
MKPSFECADVLSPPTDAPDRDFYADVRAMSHARHHAKRRKTRKPSGYLTKPQNRRPNDAMIVIAGWKQIPRRLGGGFYREENGANASEMESGFADGDFELEICEYLDWRIELDAKREAEHEAMEEAKAEVYAMAEALALEVLSEASECCGDDVVLELNWIWVSDAGGPGLEKIRTMDGPSIELWLMKVEEKDTAYDIFRRCTSRNM